MTPTPEQRKRLAELEKTIAEQDERDRRQEEMARLLQLAHELIEVDSALEAVADDVAASILSLAAQLAELDLIDEDNQGTPKFEFDLGSGVFVNAIEADHPDDGTRLYTFDGVDTIVATRMRSDGRYEHSVLDEYGMPIEWRTAYNPTLN